MPVLGYKAYWHVELLSVRTEFKDIIKQHPKARGVIEKVHNIIYCLAVLMPKNTGEIEAWANIVRRAEADRASFCRVLEEEDCSVSCTGFIHSPKVN